MNSRPRIVFISYAHEDGAFVNAFAAALLGYDMNVWKDAKDIPIGGNILRNIYEGIKNASHFCCVISAHSVRSRWVEEELSFARTRHLDDESLAIVPVLIDEVEIPDYLKVYRCAHLENRDLSTRNPEMLMVLKAFGTDLHVHLRKILTGADRRTLLRCCAGLRYAIREFRDALGRLQADANARTVAVRNRGYDPPRKQGRRASARFNRPTTYGSDYRIRQAEQDIASAMRVAGATASRVRDALAAVHQANQKADPSQTVERLSVLLHLDRLSHMTGTIAGATEEGHAWWLGQKLSEWVTALPSEEASVAEAMALLRSWARFDPPGDAGAAVEEEADEEELEDEHDEEADDEDEDEP